MGGRPKKRRASKRKRGPTTVGFHLRLGSNPVRPEMYEEWDRVNYAQRVAEKSGDYAAVERAKDEVRRVYGEMQEQRRMSRNSSDSEWTEIGRFDAGWRAFNEMTARQMQSAANIAGRIETMPSRSRPGKISYVVSLKVIDGPKQSLDFLESQYVGPEYEPKNPFQKNRGRRTSRRAKRTSRRAA